MGNGFESVADGAMRDLIRAVLILVLLVVAAFSFSAGGPARRDVRGTTPSEAERTHAVRLTRETAGVTSVVDDLHVEC
jgi:BON domain-containing protein